jgi:hypothetical protein
VLHPPGDARLDSSDEYGRLIPGYEQVVQKYSRKLEGIMEKWLIVQGFRNEVRQMGHNGPDLEMGVSQNFDLPFHDIHFLILHPPVGSIPDSDLIIP